MAFKRLPTDKTIVAELKLEIADQFTRVKIAKESMAARISEDLGISSGDFSVTNTTPLILNNIKKMVYIKCYGEVLLRIGYQTTAVQEMPCRGLFLYYGEIDSLEIRSSSAEVLRVSYIYA
jgi:hypothetical protein